MEPDLENLWSGLGRSSCRWAVEPDEPCEKRAAKVEAAEERGFRLIWWREERGVEVDDGVVADATKCVCDTTSVVWERESVR